MIRSSISGAFGSSVAERYCRSLAIGKPWQVTARTWQMVPRYIREWLRRRVIDPAEKESLARLGNHDPLARYLQNQFTDYSLPATSIMMLWDLLHDVKPRRIIEAGSGLSTITFALYARMVEERGGVPPLLVSLEHDLKWAESTRAMLSRQGLLRFACVIDAPIAQVDICGESVKGYDVSQAFLAEAAGDTGFDFFLIDGPPAQSVGRLASLLVAKEYLAAGATVILDDALRDHEWACWARWVTLTSGALTAGTLVLIPHGMLVGKWEPKRASLSQSTVE